MSICVLSLVLIAQAVFLLERGQTETQTRLNALPMPVAMPAWVITEVVELSNIVIRPTCLFTVLSMQSIMQSS